MFHTGDKTADREVEPDDAHFSLERDLGEKGKDTVMGRLGSRPNSSVDTLGRCGTSVMYVKVKKYCQKSIVKLYLFQLKHSCKLLKTRRFICLIYPEHKSVHTNCKNMLKIVHKN